MPRRASLQASTPVPHPMSSTVRAELVDDGLVVVQVGPITVEVVVDRGEPRVGEDLIRHVAIDMGTLATR